MGHGRGRCQDFLVTNLQLFTPPFSCPHELKGDVGRVRNSAARTCNRQTIKNVDSDRREVKASRFGESKPGRREQFISARRQRPIKICHAPGIGDEEASIEAPNAARRCNGSGKEPKSCEGRRVTGGEKCEPSARSWSRKRKRLTDDETRLLEGLTNCGERQATRPLRAKPASNPRHEPAHGLRFQVRDNRDPAVIGAEPAARENELAGHEFVGCMPSAQKYLLDSVLPADENERGGITRSHEIGSPAQG